MAVPWPTPMPVLMRVVLIQASRWRATEEHPHARHWRNEATSVCASAWSSTTITAGSFSHRTILATGPAVGKGQVVLKPGPPHRPKASRPTTWIKRARTPRNRHHHAGDGTGSTRLPIEPSQPSSPTLTPRGIHVVIHRVALHLPGTPGLLGGRVHLSLQPPQVQSSWPAVLPATPTSRRGRPP